MVLKREAEVGLGGGVGRGGGDGLTNALNAPS